VLYLVGPEIQSAAAPVIASWVEKGGVLLACGGAGLLDEYRQRLDAMCALYGIAEAELVREQRKVAPRSLDDMPALDTLRLADGTMDLPEIALPALAYRQVYRLPAEQEVAAGNAVVVGRFEDGSAGALVRQVGAGHAIVIGTMPGLAYLRPAMRDEGDLPVGYSRPVRELLTAPLRLAGCVPHVVTSEPLVEAQLMESVVHGVIEPLINVSPAPIDKLRVRFPGLNGVKSCRSIRRGKLPVRGTGRDCHVELPLEIADFLVLD
jgi:hypothetical protein